MKFPWESDEKPTAPTDPEMDAALGVESAGNPAVMAARANAETAIQASPRRRRRSPKDTEVSDGSKRAISPELQAEIARQIDAATDPKAWGALLAMPGDVAMALTGRDFWEISKDETDTLGACGSAMAKVMMIHSPKTLVGVMFASALFSAYVPRLIKEAKYHRVKKEGPKNETQKVADA